MDTFNFEEISQEINEIFQTIHGLSVKEQSKYANPDFIKQMWSGYEYTDTAGDIYNLPFEYWTVSYIGNLAHLALTAPLCKKFEKALVNYCQFRINHLELKKPKSILETTWSEIGMCIWKMLRTFLNEK